MLKKLFSKLLGRDTNDSESVEQEVQRSTSDTRHVMSTEEGWVILKEKDGSSTMTFDTKREAVDEARTVCKEKGLRLAIYKQDGTQQREHDYS